jgi:hypothetical protein
MLYRVRVEEADMSKTERGKRMSDARRQSKSGNALAFYDKESDRIYQRGNLAVKTRMEVIKYGNTNTTNTNTKAGSEPSPKTDGTAPAPDGGVKKNRRQVLTLLAGFLK